MRETYKGSLEAENKKTRTEAGFFGACTERELRLSSVEARKRFEVEMGSVELPSGKAE